MKKKKGPWTITETRVVYENPWMKVVEDQVITPDGKKGIFGTVVQSGGATVIPMDEDGNVYLTEEYHYAVGEITIEGVSGSTDGNESRLETAKRELKEEVGIHAREWIDLGCINPFTTTLNSPNHMYLAKGLSYGEQDLDPTETLKVVKVIFKEALEMVDSGKISHGATVVALLKIKILLQN